MQPQDVDLEGEVTKPDMEEVLAQERQRYTAYEKRVELWKDKVKQLSIKDREKIRQLELALAEEKKLSKPTDKDHIVSLEKELKAKNDLLKEKEEELQHLTETTLATQERYLKEINESEVRYKRLEEELRSKPSNSSEKIQSLEQLNDALQKSLDESAHRIETLTSQQKAWKAKAVAVTQRDRQRIQELQHEVEQLKSRDTEPLEDSKSHTGSSNSRNSELVVKLQETEAQVAKSRAQIVDLEAKLAEVTQERDHQQAALQSQLLDTTHQCTTQISKIQDQLKSVKAKRDSFSVAADEAQMQVIQLKQEIAQLREECHHNKNLQNYRDVQDIETQHQQQFAHDKPPQNSVQTLQLSLDQPHHEAVAESRVAELTADVAASAAEREQLESLRAKSDAAETRVLELERQVEELNSERDRRASELEAELVGVSAERDRYSSAASAAGEELAQLRTRLSELSAEREREVAELETRVSALTDEQGQLRDAAAAAESRVAELTADLADVVEKKKLVEDQLTAELSVSEGRREKLDQVHEKMGKWKEKVLARVQAESRRVAVLERVSVSFAETFLLVEKSLVSLQEKWISTDSLKSEHLLKELCSSPVDANALVEAATLPLGKESESQAENRLQSVLSCQMEWVRELMHAIQTLLEQFELNGEKVQVLREENAQMEAALAEQQKTLQQAEQSTQHAKDECDALRTKLTNLSESQQKRAEQWELECAERVKEAVQQASRAHAEEEAETKQRIAEAEVAHRAQLHQLEVRCDLLKKEVVKLKKAASSVVPVSPASESCTSLSRMERDAATQPPQAAPHDPSETPRSAASNASAFNDRKGSGEMKVSLEAELTSTAYMRNVIFQFLSSTEDLRVKMIPAIVTVLGFNRLEKGAIASANPSCPPLR